MGSQFSKEFVRLSDIISHVAMVERLENIRIGESISEMSGAVLTTLCF